MEYKGKLYGKVGKTYFPMVETAEDFDKLKQEHAEMAEALKSLTNLFAKEYDEDSIGGIKISKAKELLNKIKENGKD